MGSHTRSVAVFTVWLLTYQAGAVVTNLADICVYGGTSGGVAAAVQAGRMGKSVCLVVFNNHLGGMTSGGLGWTDFGNKSAIGGVSLEFYMRVGAKYGAATPAYTFEPHVAETVFGEMTASAGVPVHTNQRLESVTMDDARIVSIHMQNGDVFRAGMFIDATYEGDLLALAGVSYTVGREANSRYNEVANGVVNPPRATHNFGVAVDPFVTPGDPGSGLLPYIQDGGIDAGGAADHRIQAYNFRMCLTTDVSNQLPITAPVGYSPDTYELLARYIRASGAVTLNSFLKIDPMPNSKTDINNQGAFSTDFIGQNWDYPDADYTRREQIWRAHEDYIRGLLYYLGHDTNVPVNVRASMLAYGLCRDEFPDTGGWPHQLYVREARRMVSDYVMTESNCRNTILPYDGIGLAAYTMDSHNCRRYVTADGRVRNEGDVQDRVLTPYRIAYRALVPRRETCGNLLVPWSLSASHIAFGSIRMEPVFMVLGQSAATAAAHAIDAGVAVQDVDITNLQARLESDGQVISWGTPANARPMVELTQPRMDAVFPVGTNMLITADAWDTDGTIARVEFYASNAKIGEDVDAPYLLVWTNPYPARLTLTARAVDNDGAENMSGIVPIRVGTTNDAGSAEDGIIIDNADVAYVSKVGTWLTSTAIAGYYGSDYAHDGNTGQGTKSFRFLPALPVSGVYNTYIRFSANANRSTVVPVDIVHAGGTSTLTFDQSMAHLNGRWIFAGAYAYLSDASSAVVVRNSGADGYVTADAVSFSLVGTNAMPTNATTLIYDYFNDYGTNGLDRLHGMNGGQGWLSSWVNDVGDTVGYDAGMRTDYDVPDYSSDGNLAGPSHGRARMAPGDSPAAILRRSFASPLTGTVWLSCLLRHEDAAVGDVLLWFETVASGSDANTFVGLRQGDVPTMRYGGFDVSGSELQTAGKDLLLLVKLVLDTSGTADSLSFWIKTEQDDIRTEARLGAALLSISSADILGANLTYLGLSGGAGRNANIDALRISNRPSAFKDVVEPVPWPGLYSTDFPGAEGPMPADWDVREGLIGSPGWRMDSGGDLRYDGPVTNGIAVYAGDLLSDDMSRLTNSLVDATFRKTDGSFAGLVGRLQDAANYYHARLRGRNQLEIYRFSSGVPVLLGEAVTASDDYDIGETWRIRLAIRGTTIMADLFNQADALVARQVVTDATFSSGFSGLRTSNPAAYETFRIEGYALQPPPQGMFIIAR